MASIQIQNIGALIDTGIVKLNQFNIIMGKQSTGKSTFMKILCYCQWMEKSIMTSDEKWLYNYTHYNRFLKDMMKFHRFDASHFSPTSRIHYIGETVTISLVGNKSNVKITKIKEFESKRHNVKLAFIPAERNLVSVIKNIDRTYKADSYDVVFNHIWEWSDTKKNYTVGKPLDISAVHKNMSYHFDADKKRDIILMDNNKPILTYYASSGIQSALPIIAMVDYYTDAIFKESTKVSQANLQKILANLLNDDDLSVASAIKSAMLKQYKYLNSKLYIEEPEQNLFPESQQALVNEMVQKVCRAAGEDDYENTLTITTHSPYIITAFNVLLKAGLAVATKPNRRAEIEKVYTPLSVDKVAAYFISEAGEFTPVVDSEYAMICGNDLDMASTAVDDSISYLNDIIYE